MSFADTTTALYSYLDGLSLGYDIAYDNVDFTQDNDIWIQASILPADVLIITNGYDRHTGILQLIINNANTDGFAGSSDLVDTILTSFKRGTDMTHNGTVVRIISPPVVAPPLKDGSLFSIPISIEYITDKGV